MMKKAVLIAAAAASLPNPTLASSSSHGGLLPSAFAISASYRRVPTNLVGGRGVSVLGSNNCRLPRTPSSTILAAQPGKGDLYNDDELFELLTLHQALNPEDTTGQGLFSGTNGQEDSENLNEESIAGGIHDWVLETLHEDDVVAKPKSSSTSDINDDVAEASGIPGLHDLVLEAIADIDASNSNAKQKEDNVQPNQVAYDNLQTLLRDKKPYIRAIASDVDGTLLSGQTLHPVTKEAVLKAIDHSYNEDANSENEQKIQHFFPATGKSRKGAALSLGPTLGPLLYKIPGVYIQGLYCVDKEGNVVFEKKLSASAVRAAEELVAECNISIVGYDGDDLYTTQKTEVVRSLSEYYGEPTVEYSYCSKNTILTLTEHGPLHKLLLMDEDVDKLVSVVRPKLEALAELHGATVTQAVPTMLELLPEGCSKAFGVGKVCEALGIDVTTELLALGDAENDAGMLRNAAIGVAVGNACPQARDAADFIMSERNDEGGAGLAMNLFGF